MRNDRLLISAACLVVAVMVCPFARSARAAMVRLPGQWYDTDKTNNGVRHRTNELWGMYYNYYRDNNHNGLYDFAEPWVETFVPDTDSNWQEDNQEDWGFWRVGRDESCWAASANNMVRYAGAGSRYIGWVYDGAWADGSLYTWEQSGTVSGALGADDFPFDRQDATNGAWAFDAPGWISDALARGLPVGLGGFWHDDTTGPPNPTGGHAFSVYAIDTAAQTITLADNSRDFAISPTEQEDYTTFDYTFDPANDYFLVPDFRPDGAITAHVSVMTTFALTRWQGSGVNGANTGDWHTPINWQGGTVPTASGQQQFPYIEFTEGGLVVIDSPAAARMLTVRGALTTIDIDPAGSLTVGNLNVGDGQLTVRGQATVYRADVVSGTVLVDGGTFNAVKDSALDYGNVTCGGTIIVRGGGTLAVANDFRTDPGAVITVQGGGMLTVANTLRTDPGGTFTVVDPLSAVHVDFDFEASGDVNVVGGGSLVVGNILHAGVGDNPAATDIEITQGTVNVGNQMLLGKDHAAVVTATRSTLDVASLLSVGETDSGTLNLYGGQVEAMYLFLGHGPQADGHMLLDLDSRLVGPQVNMRGTDTLAPRVVVGDDGAAGVIHNAGTLGPVDPQRDQLTVTLGYGPAGVGKYLLTHGQISTYDLLVGRDGTGAFDQQGGLVTVDNRFSLAAGADSKGTYRISEGAVQTGELFVGVAGDGTFTQAGGLVTVSTRLELGGAAGANGRYELDDGTTNAPETIVGSAGPGTFVQSGGQHNVAGDLVLGNMLDAHGTYQYSGGGLAVGGDVWVGRNGGTGTFEIAGPVLPSTGGTLHITGDASALTGWGRIDMLVAHDAGDVNVNSGLLALEQGYTGQGRVTVEPTGELGIEANSTFTGKVVNTGHVRIRKGVTQLAGQMLGSGVGRVTVDATARLDVSCEIDEIHTLAVAAGGRVQHLAGESEVVGAVELHGIYHLSAGAVLTSARAEVDGLFFHDGGEHESGQIWIGALAAPALYAIDAGLLKVADLHVGRSFADGNAPGVLRITDPAANVTVSGLLAIHQLGSVDAVAGATIHMTGSAFENLSTDPSAVAGLANVELVFEGGPLPLDPFEVAGADRGAVPGGFDQNFALGALTLGNGTTIARVQLVDLANNHLLSRGAEALYVKELTVGADSTLDLQGLNLYCMTAAIDPTATVTGGELALVDMAIASGVPVGMAVSPVYDPSGSMGLGVSGLNGVRLLGGTASLDAAEVDAAVAASPDGFITLTMYYLEDELADLGIPEDTLRPYWLHDGVWVLGGTTTAGGEGVGQFAGVNVDPGAFGVGTFGLNTVDNSIWNHVTHASTYGAAGVPEPATLAILAAGALLITLRRKRR